MDHREIACSRAGDERNQFLFRLTMQIAEAAIPLCVFLVEKTCA